MSTGDNERYGRRALLRMAAGLSASGLIAGCTGQNGQDGSDGGDGEDGSPTATMTSEPEVFEYNLATASSGGAWAVQGAGFAQLWNELERVQVTAINTAGGGENPILVRDGEAGIGFQSGSNLYAVLFGEGPYDEAIELHSAFRTNTNPVWYTAREDSGMEFLEDLDGKRVAVGPRGSNANYESQLFFDHLGIDINRKFLTFSDAANAMASNQIDAMIVYGLFPAVQQLAEQTDIIPLKYGDAYDSMLEEFPWAVESAFPAPAVDWYDDSIPLVGKDIYLVTRPEIPADFTYLITKHTFENIEDARDIHFLLGGMNLEDATRDLDGNIDIHEGSRQYFEEEGVL